MKNTYKIFEILDEAYEQRVEEILSKEQIEDLHRLLNLYTRKTLNPYGLCNLVCYGDLYDILRDWETYAA